MTSLVPDVTVVVPVYNTLAHLPACLDSLVGQTIGHDRMHVVAVDDGSTDGSGELLEEYAARHPGLFTVLHQENSGGPAGPCNVALGVATGRYVFFLGSDDWLGLEALARMVAKADEWESDVVCVRLVGTNGRVISQRLFEENQPEIPFLDQRPWVTANTKLFRRSVLEEHHVRYQEDIRVASDQTFTIEAMYRARRISVLGDYDYYYALLRPEGGNIMFRDDWRERLDAIEATMAYLERLIGPGDVLDTVLVRHLKWEYGNRLRDVDDFSPADQDELLERTRVACDRYLTDGMSRLMPAAIRLRLHHARAGDRAALRAHNAAILEHQGRRPVVVREGRLYVVYPGFDEPGGPPLACFEESFEPEMVARRLLVEATGAQVEGDRLVVTTQIAVDPVTAESVRIELDADRSAQGTASTAPTAPTAPTATVTEVAPLDDRSARVRFAVEADALVSSGHTWRPHVVVPVIGMDLRTRIRADERRAIGYGDHLLVARAAKNKGLLLRARQAPAPSVARGRRSRWRELIPWTSA